MKTPGKTLLPISQHPSLPSGMQRFLLSGLIGLAMILPAVNPLRAQVEGTPTLTMDFDEIEAFLQRHEMSRRAAILDQTKNLSSQLTLLLASESTLLDGYQNVYEAVVLNGDRDKIQAWEQKNKALFESDGFVLALQLHVQYLLATLTKSMGDDEAALALTQKWISDFLGAGPKFKAMVQQPLLTESVSQSMFLRAPSEALTVKARHISRVASTSPAPQARSPAPAGRTVAPTFRLAEIKQWYLGPLANLPEIHRVNIIGYLRNNKNPQIFEEWKRNLSLEQDLAQRKGSAEQQEAFTTSRRPWILWQTGKDYALFDRPGAAANIMVQAIKENSYGADYDKIAADIRRIIAESRQAPAQKSAAPPAARPAQSPPANAPPRAPVSQLGEQP